MQFEYVKSNKNQILEGVLLIKPKVFKDLRGEFFESWNFKEFNDVIKRKVNFVQDNFSRSSKGVLRGLHFQNKPYGQCKLVQVLDGEIIDFVVDIRYKSKDFGKFIKIKLSSNNKKQLFIDSGFAHGFLTTSKTALVSYKVDKYYNKQNSITLNLFDKDLSININKYSDKIILSNNDKNEVYKLKL